MLFPSSHNWFWLIKKKIRKKERVFENRELGQRRNSCFPTQTKSSLSYVKSYCSIARLNLVLHFLRLASFFLYWRIFYYKKYEIIAPIARQVFNYCTMSIMLFEVTQSSLYFTSVIIHEKNQQFLTFRQD